MRPNITRDILAFPTQIRIRLEKSKPIFFRQRHYRHAKVESLSAVGIPALFVPFSDFDVLCVVNGIPRHREQFDALVGTKQPA
jgi:hypothetical protein